MRRIAAAEAALASGASLQVHALIALAKPALRDPVMTARADRLDGNAWRREGKTAIAAPLLLSAAVALMPTDPRLARQTLLEAIEAVLIAGSAAGDDVISAVTEAVRATPPGDDTLVDLLLDAFGTYLAAGFVAAAPALRVAVTAMSSAEMPADQLIRWVQFAVFATRALWDDEAHSKLTARLAQASREQGALMWLAVALKARATDEVWAGRFDAAEIDLADAADVTLGRGRTSDEHRNDGARGGRHPGPRCGDTGQCPHSHAERGRARLGFRRAVRPPRPAPARPRRGRVPAKHSATPSRR